MTRALLDVNVLLALAWPNHQFHAAAQAWFAREGRKAWATCALTQLSFVRLSANPAFTPLPATPRGAAALLEQMTAHPAHDYWDTLPPAFEELFARAMGHQQVMDTYLVRLAEQHRGRLTTFDRHVALHASSDAAIVVIRP